MPKSDIPGYDEELDRERRVRTEIFLGEPADICGLKIRQITPLLFSRLLLMRTPFLESDEAMTEAEILRFLWSLSVDFSTEEGKRDEWLKVALIKIIEGGGFDRAEDEIQLFLDETFLDAPHGGRESVPYTTAIAWMVYKMACVPFGWDKDRTMTTPIREIYQYLRCDALAKGQALINSWSDKLRAAWLQELRDAAANNQTGGAN